MDTSRAWYSPVTDQDHPQRHRPLPDWAHRLVFTSVRWSVAPAYREGGAYPWIEHVERLPEVGSLQWVNVDDCFSLPRDGGPVWALFLPPMTEVNGWDDDDAEDIGRASLVRIELVEVVSRQAREAWLRVRVLEVWPVTELIDRCPPCRDPAPLHGPDTDGPMRGDPRFLVQCRDLAVCHVTGDDETIWALCQHRAGRWHLLLFVGWWYIRGAGYAGHRPLSRGEAAHLGLPDPDSLTSPTP